MTPAVAGMRGPEIPGFRWVRPLGQGGFADVFLYRQELPSREVAIKVVRTQGDERGTKELHREADAMTLLAGHPAVVELHGVGTTADGRAYLVMEYCPVADLLTQVRARLAFLPIVRAAFGRFILDLIRRIKPMRSGKHATEAHPGTMFLGVVASLVVLGLVGMVAWGMCGQAALDWRDGPVTREGVTCTAMNPEERDDGPFVHIELTESEGVVRAYDLRQYELDRHAEKGTPLYNTIVEACQAPGTQIGISIYDRTGIIVDAWKK